MKNIVDFPRGYVHMYTHIPREASATVCSTKMGNSRASSCGTDSLVRFSRFFYIHISRRRGPGGTTVTIKGKMKKFILTLACGLSALAVSAAPLTPEAALSRVFETGGKKAPSVQKRSYSLQFSKSIEGKDAVYVFSSGKDNGYMVVSADDASTPLLGFSLTGTLPSSEASLPDGMRYWLDALAEQVAFNAANVSSIRKVEQPPYNRDAIDPMLRTKWNQGVPYNSLCPRLDGISCVTGCVATAMAQIMKYHNYPANVQDNHSYKLTDSFQLSIDPSITFNWDSMLDVYDDQSADESKTAVATLMSACGIAANMSYGTESSSAYDVYALRGFVESFGYDKGARLLFRDEYSANEWEDIVYNNLKNFGPMYYSGMSNTEGHAFVCDGYSDGYFHLNWGWGGLSDGYFLLSALDPVIQGIGGHQSGYNFNQCVIANLSPQQITENIDQQLTWSSDFFIDSEMGHVNLLPSGDYYKPKILGSFYNYNYTSVSDYKIGVIIISEDKKETFIASSKTCQTLEPRYGYKNAKAEFELPWDLEEGNYTVVPAYIIGEGSPKKFRVPNNMVASYTMVIEGNRAEFREDWPLVAYLKAEDFKLLTHKIRSENVLFKGQKFKCSAKITNPSETEEFDGYINVAVLGGYNDGRPILAPGERLHIAIAPGESADIEIVTALDYDYSTDSDGNPSVKDTGNYNMYLLADGYILAEPINFTHMPETDNSMSVTDLQVESDQSPEKVMATATVDCPNGYFGGTLRLYVYAEDQLDVPFTKSDSELLIVSKSSPITATWKIDMSGADSSKQYLAGVYDLTKNEWVHDKNAYFTLPTTVGIGSYNGDCSTVVERRYMTVTGIDLGTEKPACGIYIVSDTFADGSVKTYKSTVSPMSHR